MNTVAEHTIKSAMAHAEEQLGDHGTTARIDGQALLCFVLDQNRSHLYTWPEQPLTGRQWRLFERLIELRRQGEPVAYLTGQREFWSLPLKVTRDTLIPRPETELLVEHALQRIPRDQEYCIADLGTGSGAIALALATERPQTWLWAFDRSDEALDVARDNAVALGISNIRWQSGDWLHGFSDAQFDMIVANPPYVRANDPHLDQGDLPYEPHLALVSGPDGLEAIEIIIRQARRHLKPGGWLILEHGHDQQQQIRALLHTREYIAIECFADLAGQPRLTLARLRHQNTHPPADTGT